MGHPGSWEENNNLAEATLLHEAEVFGAYCGMHAHPSQRQLGHMAPPRLLPSDTDVHQSDTPQWGKERCPDPLSGENALWGVTAPCHPN